MAIALGARAARRDVPLWVLVLAAQACDWVEILLRATSARRAAGVLSHAFPPVVLAAVAAAVGVALWKRSLGAGVIVLAVYLSHPVADLATGYKPFWLGGPPVGLHYIVRPLPDFLVQGSVCVIGWAFYARSVWRERVSSLRVFAPLVVLLALQAVSDLVVFVRAR